MKQLSTLSLPTEVGRSAVCVLNHFVSAQARCRRGTCDTVASSRVVEAADRCADALGELNMAHADQQDNRINDLASQMNLGRHQAGTQYRPGLPNVPANSPRRLEHGGE
jgi:hypothetical protein